LQENYIAGELEEVFQQFFIAELDEDPDICSLRVCGIFFEGVDVADGPAFEDLGENLPKMSLILGMGTGLEAVNEDRDVCGNEGDYIIFFGVVDREIIEKFYVFVEIFNGLHEC
jgi:hypothetical protein